MSEIPQDQLSYRQLVAEYYLELRGAGLMLSPLDAEQVADWERRGVPIAVVCRGMRRGFEASLEALGDSEPESVEAVFKAVGTAILRMVVEVDDDLVEEARRRTNEIERVRD